MRREILRFSDNNMAGFDWTWSFIVERHPDGTYSLLAEIEMADPNDQAYAMDLEPVVGLRRGADIYRHLDQMLASVGAELGNFDLDEIARTLAEFDANLSDQFRRGEQLLRRRERRLDLDRRRRWFRALAPFRSAIDSYCEKLDDNRTRGGGGIQRPSEKARVMAFLEEYVSSTGELPNGFHSWQLSNGFMSGSRDFGSFGEEAQAQIADAIRKGRSYDADAGN